MPACAATTGSPTSSRSDASGTAASARPTSPTSSSRREQEVLVRRALRVRRQAVHDGVALGRGLAYTYGQSRPDRQRPLQPRLSRHAATIRAIRRRTTSGTGSCSTGSSACRGTSESRRSSRSARDFPTRSWTPASASTGLSSRLELNGGRQRARSRISPGTSAPEGLQSRAGARRPRRRGLQPDQPQQLSDASTGFISKLPGGSIRTSASRAVS